MDSIYFKFCSTVGFDNSAALLNFCMYELAKDKVIQQKARESVMKSLEKNDNNFTYDSIHEMTYLEQCINGKFEVDYLLFLTS